MATKTKQHHIIQSFKSTFLVMLFTFLSISAIVYLIWQRNSVDIVMKDIDLLNHQHEQITLEINRLNQRIANLSHIDRIRKIASREFNLKEARKKPILFIVKDAKYKNELTKLSKHIQLKKIYLKRNNLLLEQDFNATSK